MHPSLLIPGAWIYQALFVFTDETISELFFLSKLHYRFHVVCVELWTEWDRSFIGWCSKIWALSVCWVKCPACDDEKRSYICSRSRRSVQLFFSPLVLCFCMAWIWGRNELCIVDTALLLSYGRKSAPVYRYLLYNHLCTNLGFVLLLLSLFNTDRDSELSLFALRSNSEPSPP